MVGNNGLHVLQNSRGNKQEQARYVSCASSTLGSVGVGNLGSKSVVNKDDMVAYVASSDWLEITRQISLFVHMHYWADMILVIDEVYGWDKKPGLCLCFSPSIMLL